MCEQKTDRGVRIGVINNPSGKPSQDNTLLYRAIWATLLTQKNKAASEFVQKLLKEESSQLLQQGTKIKDLLIQVREGLKIWIHSFIHSWYILLCNCVVRYSGQIFRLLGFDQIMKYYLIITVQLSHPHLWDMTSCPFRK